MTKSLFNAVMIGLLIITGCKKDGGTDGGDNNQTSKQAYVPDLSGSYTSPNETLTTKAIRIQKDGKILVLGYQWFVRLEKDGVTVDNTFKPVNEIASSTRVNSFELQDDGKIIVFGSFTISNGRKAIVRLNTDGSLDNSFNNPDLDINYQAQDIEIYAVKLLASGNMVIAGALSYRTGPTSFGDGIARLNADQSLDYNFTSPISTADVYNVHSMLPLSDGGFLLTGYGAITLKDGFNYAVVKINADGAHDKSFVFDSGGVFNASSVIGLDMKELADEKVLISWYEYDSQSDWSHVTRLNSNGSVDVGFNDFYIGGYIKALSVLPDKSIFAGNDPNGNLPYEKKYLSYLNTGGKEDTTFHPGFSSRSSVLCFANVDETTVLVGGSLFLDDKKYSVIRFKKNK